jgi:hypothetical protein
MKLRHFKLEDGKMVLDDFNGDFVHVNDIELLFLKERNNRQKLVDQYKDSDVEWQKRCHDMNQQCVYLINDFLNII